MLALGTLVVALAGGRSQRGRVLSRLSRLRRRPVPDDTLETRVKRRLTHLSPHAALLHVTLEHGCVTLAGLVRTEERAKIVREIARLDGVDSVIDLMTESRAPNANVEHPRDRQASL